MIEIQQVASLNEGEKLWCELSPNKTIFDEWGFRYSFYKYSPLPICFLAAYSSETSGEFKNLVGLLPLQKHPKHGFEFFAEDPCEENHPFIKPGYEYIIPELYKAIPGAAKAYDISGDDDFTKQLPLEDYKYVLPLAGIYSYSDFLNSRLSVKRGHALLKEINRVEKLGINVEVINDRLEARFSALEILFNLNIDNFGEDSYLLEKDQAAWRDLMTLNFCWRIIVCKIDSVIEAVSLSVLHSEQWHYLLTGVNFKKYPGLGKYLAKVNIEEAIISGANVFDAGLGDCGWKNIWHFDKISQYNFENNK